MSAPQIYLASASPRRAELLRQLGVDFQLLVQDVPERRLPGEAAEDFVRRLAMEKAQAAWRQLLESPQRGGKSPQRGDKSPQRGNKSHQRGNKSRPVLGADTVVVVDNEILGKPRDREHALAMLGSLSGRMHRVLTAVAVVARDDLGQDRLRLACSESKVWFRSLSQAEREAYWCSGEPQDKAGAYGIQGLGALFVQRLEGSYSGVMGLPLFETGELLREFGLEILRSEKNKQG